MVKLILGIILITCTTLVGNWFSSRLERRLKTLGTVVESIRKMKTLICFGGYEIYRVISISFENTEGFENFCTPPEDDTDFMTWWRESVNSIDRSCGLNSEDKAILLRFAEGIGVSDTEGQIANFDLYAELFLERLTESKESEKNKAHLYRVLGFSLGCATVLIML